eukprot:CAMPEP_0195507036 /NCGR_PEP_ID=MMETSP0794_2-20130614/562_1 /TAXON_ID=515487 /ORGANISM="Stephanopyxis turris, Strain CCMP 815" /LENGTH=498 /DNA_ID=CAMNT_0040633571 /DNA_START=139 /DNA_END=1631 /DNA_ORIENTATION=-
MPAFPRRSLALAFAAVTGTSHHILRWRVPFAAGMVSSSSMPPLARNTVSGKMSEHLPLAKKAMEYFDESPDPFHAVQTSVNRLKEKGYSELDDCVPYSGLIKPGGKYYFTRNKSTLVAFTVGGKFKPGNGFKVIGGHTDSPNLKVKPHSKRSSAGYVQIGVECYGGGLWHTWFDRDLGIAGRVLVRNEDGGIDQKLIKIDRAILRIPNLAIHLQSVDERKAFAVNKEDHLAPIIANEAKKALNGQKEDDDDEDSWKSHQDSLLLELICAELDVEIDDIADFELNLFDVQKAALGGIHSEYIHSARLDNLASCFLALESLVDHSDKYLEEDEDVSLVALFDHEEVGSASTTGAGSPIMGESVKRISTALNAGEGDFDLYSSAIHKSFVLSVDQAHAIHPNYASKHEKKHAPMMNKGMVIKRNSNQRYATNSITALLVRDIAKKVGLPEVQEFVVRNDCGCGSTIGPIISANTGIRSIDLGCPQLSMHSIRETMGVADLS